MAAASSSDNIVFLITIPLVLKGQHLHGNDLETGQILKCQKEHNRYATNGFSVAAQQLIPTTGYVDEFQCN